MFNIEKKKISWKSSTLDHLLIFWALFFRELKPELKGNKAITISLSGWHFVFKRFQLKLTD